MLATVIAALGALAVAGSALGTASAAGHHYLRLKVPTATKSFVVMQATLADGRQVVGQCFDIANMGVSKGYLLTGLRVRNGTPLTLITSDTVCGSTAQGRGGGSQSTVPDDTNYSYWVDASTPKTIQGPVFANPPMIGPGKQDPAPTSPANPKSGGADQAPPPPPAAPPKSGGHNLRVRLGAHKAFVVLAATDVDGSPITQRCMDATGLTGIQGFLSTGIQLKNGTDVTAAGLPMTCAELTKEFTGFVVTTATIQDDGNVDFWMDISR